MNDDDADFKPSHSTSSNLTSLFDTNRPRPSGNQTLTYTAPKPPKGGENSSTPVRGSSTKSLGAEKLEIIVSKTIQLYKLENDRYIGQGAAGIAIIGHHDLHIYQIILYKNNREYLSKSYLQPNFIFTVLENNYASFYDNTRQNWSILFPSSSDVQNFAKQVAIAKYNSQSKKEKIIVQDLMQCGSTKANKKDIVNLEYSCYLLNNDDVVPFKEKCRLSVEINDDYTFPWQEGLKDCGCKCKRVIIIPYGLSAPWTAEIQQNNSVMVEYEVESVRSPKRPGQNKTMPIKARIQDDSTTDSSAEEDNCRVKPVSLKESIVLSRPHKADVMSRIAKMGQALPLKLAFAYGPNDIPDEGSLSSRQENSQAMSSNFHPCSPQQIDDHQQYLLSTNSSHTREVDAPFQHQQMAGGMNFAYQELHPVMSGSPVLLGQNYLRGMEVAGSDAELRLTINKVSQKVDHVLNKLQNIDASNWDRVKTHQSAPILDPVSVINSIQDVMAENESLKMEIQQQKSKINEQGNKLHSLMELTQRCVERCSYPPSTVTLPEEKGSEERPNSSNQLLAEATTRINRLTAEIKNYRIEISENEKQIKQFQTEMQSLVEKLTEKDKIIQNMEAELIQTTAEKKALISVNEQQKEDIQRFKQQESTEKRASASSEESVEEIKRVMNAVNRKFQSYFDSVQAYSGKDIKATIARTLKEVTMEYLKYRKIQKTGSQLDVEEREISRTKNRGNTHNQLASESSEGVMEGECLRNEKSRSRPIKESSDGLVEQTRSYSNDEMSSLSESNSTTHEKRCVDDQESVMTSSRIFPNSVKTPAMQSYSKSSPSTASRVSSGGDESLRGDSSLMINEQDSLLEDHKPENTEVGKTNLVRCTVTKTEHSEMEENETRKGRNRRVSEEESSVFIPAERSDGSWDEALKGSRKSKTHAAPVRTTSLSRETLPEVDESMRGQNEIVFREEGNASVSRTGPQGVVPQESEIWTNFSDSLDSETLQKSLSMSDGKNVNGSTCTTGSVKHSSSPSFITERQTRDAGKSGSEAELGGIKSLKTSVKVGDMVKNEMEKSTFHVNNKNESSVLDSDNRIPQADVTEKSSRERDRKSAKEEIGFSNEKEDEKMSPSSSDEKEKVKLSGSNAVNESSLYSDYFQGWESSKPPPLPLEDEEEGSEPDEEWL